MLKFSGLVLSSLMMANMAFGQEDCGCSKVDIFDYPVADSRDADYTEHYPWEALTVSPKTGMSSCRIDIGLVDGDHPGIDTLPSGEYSHLELILVNGIWIDFDVFEKQMRAVNCMPFAS